MDHTMPTFLYLPFSRTDYASAPWTAYVLAQLRTQCLAFGDCRSWPYCPRIHYCPSVEWWSCKSYCFHSCVWVYQFGCWLCPGGSDPAGSDRCCSPAPVDPPTLFSVSLKKAKKLT